MPDAKTAGGSESVQVGEASRRRGRQAGRGDRTRPVEITFLLAEATFVSQEEGAGVELVVGGGLVEVCWISEIGVEDTIEGDRRS